MQLFGTKGQKFHHFPGTKGQRDKLKIFERDRTGEPKSGTGQPKFRPGRGTKQDRAEKDVLKLENDVLKQKTVF